MNSKTTMRLKQQNKDWIHFRITKIDTYISFQRYFLVAKFSSHQKVESNILISSLEKKFIIFHRIDETLAFFVMHVRNSRIEKMHQL